MKHYAKISFLNSGFKRIRAEIWKASYIDETNFDFKIQDKKFFRLSSAKKWSEKILLKATLAENPNHFFIRDIDIINEEL